LDSGPGYPGARFAAKTNTLLLLASLALALLLPVAPVAHAQTAQKLVVDSQTAEGHFPDTIKFSLKAHGYEARNAMLHYKLVGQQITTDLDASPSGGVSGFSSSVEVNLTDHYIPPGTEITYYWSLTAPSGESVNTSPGTFTLLDGRYPWKSLNDPTKRVSVHWYGASDDFGKTLLATASNALGRIEQKINAQLSRPANVWVYTKEQDFRDALPASSAEWVGGEASPSLALALVLITDPEGVSAQQQISSSIPHELTHLVLYQAIDNPDSSLPTWLNEGLAMRNQEAHYLTQEYRPLKNALHDGRVIPLSELSSAFDSPDTDTAQLAYAESLSVVSFILDDKRYGADKLKRTVAAFHSPLSEDAGINAGLGVTINELDKEWQATLSVAASSPDTAPAAPQTYSPTFAGGLLACFFNPLVWCSVLLVMIGALSLLQSRRRARNRRLLEEEGQL
jgi:hypothetical protein